MHWLRDGDLKTKFVHLSSTASRNSQKFDMLMNDNREEIRDQVGICEVARNYFEKLFTTKEGKYDPVLNLIQPLITMEDNARQLSLASKEELHVTLLDMHLEKYLGPKVFNPSFYQKFWELCSDNIFERVTHILEEVSPPRRLTKQIFVSFSSVINHMIRRSLDMFRYAI